MKQITRSVGAPTRAAAEKAARPLRRAFAKAGYELAEELWLRGTAVASQGDRIAVVHPGGGGTLRLTFIHPDNRAAVPSIGEPLTIWQLPGLRVAVGALLFLVLIGIIVLMGGPAAR